MGRIVFPDEKIKPVPIEKRVRIRTQANTSSLYAELIIKEDVINIEDGHVVTTAWVQSEDGLRIRLPYINRHLETVIEPVFDGDDLHLGKATFEICLHHTDKGFESYFLGHL